MRKQIGQILIVKGILKQENLEQALKTQAKFEKRGKHKYIGNILVKMGFITQDQLDEALHQQRDEYTGNVH